MCSQVLHILKSTSYTYSVVKDISDVGMREIKKKHVQIFGLKILGDKIGWKNCT
jgi:hypothetical protein